jgi:predicted peptidase
MFPGQGHGEENMRKAAWWILVVPILWMLFQLTEESWSQARQSLASARVAYNTRKAMAKPEGDLKRQIDEIDQMIAEATRLGRTGEVRKLYTKGMVLLSERVWDDVLEFSNSLVLRAEEVCVDSGEPYSVRVEQLYAPNIALTASLSGRAALYQISRGAGSARSGEKVKELTFLEAIGRDFLDEPARIEVDLNGIADGLYDLTVELSEREKRLASVSLRVLLQRGLHRRLAAISAELAAVRGFEALRPEVLYPLDHIRNINRGRVPLGNSDIAGELAAAEGVLASLQSGKDPFIRRTGDTERHYLLEEAGEIMPYRVYVPRSYDGDRHYPLIIALHGLGANEDSFFDSYGQVVPKLAEQHGYLVAAPLGYRGDGAYGAALARSGGDPALVRKSELSELDVMRVLNLMKKNYRVDEKRIYLMGHSMGAIGTWYLAAKYPEIWAAVAPFSGVGNPAAVETMKSIPQFVVHGAADLTVPVGGSRAMVEAMKKLGVIHQYIEVPAGDHINVVMPNLPAVFDFFDKQQKNR